MRTLAKTTLFVSALALTPALALAQGSNATNPPPNPPPATASHASSSDQSNTQAPLYQIKPGDWRASKVMGVNIYDANNEKIGDVNELIMTKDGKVDAVVVGAGGFLGLGEHDVAVPYNEVTWVNEPVKNTNTSANTRAPATTTGTTGTTGSSTPPATTANSTNNRDEYRPDHGVVKMTKDQLKQLPQVKYTSNK